MRECLVLSKLLEDIHVRKELQVGQKILDYMVSTELIAKTGEKYSRD